MRIRAVATFLMLASVVHAQLSEPLILSYGTMVSPEQVAGTFCSEAARSSARVKENDLVDEEHGMFQIERTVSRQAEIDPEMDDYREQFRAWWTAAMPHINCVGGVTYGGFPGGNVLRMLAYHGQIAAIDHLITHYEMTPDMWLFSGSDGLNLLQWIDEQIASERWIGGEMEDVDRNLRIARILIARRFGFEER